MVGGDGYRAREKMELVEGWELEVEEESWLEGRMFTMVS